MLSKDQAIAYDAIMTWWKQCQEGNGKPYFRLSGFAGCGKSYLTSYIMNNIDALSIAVVTFTWKAALVLQEKGIFQAGSIHGTFYRLIDEHHYEDTKNKNKIKHHLGFDLKPKSEVNYDLIIVDEASMVPEDMRNDMLSFGIPILFVGDAGQLPPVSSSKDASKKQFMDNAEAQLTQIHRQALDSPIIRLSMEIRNGKYIPYGKFGDGVIICKQRDISDNLLLKTDQVICAKNDTRRSLNRRIRKAKGYDPEMGPYPNERLIVIQNDHELGLFNGMMLSTTTNPLNDSHNEFRLEDSRHNFIHYKKDSNFEGERNVIHRNKFYFDGHTNFEELQQYQTELERTKERFKIIKREKLIQADFGYAVTCHKFQGSQAPKVVACFEFMKGMTTEDVIKWKYTAITRAEKKLIFSQ